MEDDLSAEMMKLAQSTKVFAIGGRDPLAFVEGGSVFGISLGFFPQKPKLTQSNAAPQKKTSLSF